MIRPEINARGAGRLSLLPVRPQAHYSCRAARPDRQRVVAHGLCIRHKPLFSKKDRPNSRSVDLDQFLRPE
jgi:hypothetical protein